jgi:hypothetical protein
VVVAVEVVELADEVEVVVAFPDEELVEPVVVSVPPSTLDRS